MPHGLMNDLALHQMFLVTRKIIADEVFKIVLSIDNCCKANIGSSYIGNTFHIYKRASIETPTTKVYIPIY